MLSLCCSKPLILAVISSWKEVQEAVEIQLQFVEYELQKLQIQATCRHATLMLVHCLIMSKVIYFVCTCMYLII